jgi:hypothetical protein
MVEKPLYHGLVAWFSVLMTTGILFWHPWNRPLVAESPVDVFWRPFLTGKPPLVIFSNALFEGDSKTGLHYAASQDSNEAVNGSYVDIYTGIGELASVYSLTRLFDAHRATSILKRSLLVTWDEAELRSVIFFGSQAENPVAASLAGDDRLHRGGSARFRRGRKPQSQTGRTCSLLAARTATDKRICHIGTACPA